MTEQVSHKAKWSLTQDAFNRLLRSLDSNPEQAGEKYEQIRRNLMSFFEWRGCSFPEDHADETINRVARKLAEGDEIQDPTTYVYGIARMLLLEIRKEQEKHQRVLAGQPHLRPGQSGPEDQERTEAYLDCLEQCLQSLPVESRLLIVEYYQNEKRDKINHRKALAEWLRIPLNALRLRAARMREKLQECVEECIEKRL